MRVVIVGGGFGGVRAALNLVNQPGFDVQLISDKSYFEYHAALYRSATGRSPLEVAIPLRDFFQIATNIEVIQDEVSSIDPTAKTLFGKSGATYHYDKAILALGSVTQYFGIEGLKEYSYGVKTIHEALEFKRHLHESLVGETRPEYRYVVVGGGATGVELAGELTGYLSRVRQRHGLGSRQFTVDLVEAADRVLPGLPDDFSKRVQQRLEELGVTLRLSSPVKGETLDSLELPSGEIKSHTVAWTAGVTNNPFFPAHPEVFRLMKNGRATVNEFLEAAPGIFVIGDSADTQFSGMAQTAIHDANSVTENLSRIVQGQRQIPYRPKKPIYAIPVGPRWSAVLWGKVRIYGLLGWALRRLADLRLYIRFLPFKEALTVWRYGITLEENCEICKR